MVLGNINKTMINSSCCNSKTLFAVVDIETNQFYAKAVDSLEYPVLNPDVDLTDDRQQLLDHQIVFVDCIKSAFKVNQRITFSVIRKAINQATAYVKENYTDVSTSMLNYCENRTLSDAFKDGCPFRLKALPVEINLIGIAVLKASTVFTAYNQKDLADILKDMKEYHTARESAKFTKPGYYMFTTTEQANNFFKTFISYHSKKDHGTGCIFAHNINYEYSMLFRKLPCLQDCVKSGTFDSLRGNGKNTIKAAYVYDNGNHDRVVVQFVDTLLYKRSSLSKIGKSYGFPKDSLDYEIEFNVKAVSNAIDKRIAGQPLDNMYNHLIDYNKIDCSIPYLIIKESLQQYAVLLADKNNMASRYPVSSNNINRIAMEAECNNLYLHRRKDTDGNSVDVIDNVPAKHVCLDSNGNIKLDKAGNAKYAADCRILDLWRNGNSKASIQSDSSTVIPDLYLKCKAVAGGGLVGVNPFITNKPIVAQQGQTIQHIDLVSAHPSQVFKRYFPSGLPVPCDSDMMDEVTKLLQQSMHDMNNKVLFPYSPFIIVTESLKGIIKQRCNYSGFGTFKLENVRIKINNNLGYNICVPSMPFMKARKRTSGDSLEGTTIIDAQAASLKETTIGKQALISSKTAADLITKNLVVDNKVFNLDSLTISCTFEDLLIFSLFYDWDTITAIDMCLYEMKPCPAYLYYIFMLYSVKKTVYKTIVGLIKDGKDIAGYMDDNRSYINETDYNYLLNNPHDIDYAEQALQLTKAIFNGIYGQNYMSNIHTTCTYTVSDDGITEDTTFDEYKAVTNRNYLVSMYIAQWSRVDLALHLAYTIQKGAVPLYWATDSIFYLEQGNTFDTYANAKGKTCLGKVMPDGSIVKPFNKQAKYLKGTRPYHKLAPLGGMDFEAPITKFCTSQNLRNVYECKCNVKLDGKEITTYASLLTFSGCNPVGAFEGCESMIDDDGKHYYDFDKASTRLITKDYNISPLQTRKSTKSKASDDTYVLLPQGFVLNNSNNFGNQIRYLLSTY